MYEPRFSISSWTLHGLISSGLPLLEVPAEIARRGIKTLELCHFHLPSTDTGYLQEFQAALRDADVEFYSILIDTGDIVAPDVAERERDVETIQKWIKVASDAGAKKVRIDAGKQSPTPEVIALSAKHLGELATFSNDLGVVTITENWHATSLQPRPLIEILNRCEGRVGLCADTGNAEGPDKYETLELLIPHATSMHFKFRLEDESQPVTSPVKKDDVERIVGMMRSAGFSGPVSLIYGGTDEEWAVTERLKTALDPYIA